MAPDVTIYHYPRCSKSRGALERLRERGVEPAVVKYLEDGPTEDEVLALLDKLPGEPADLVRTREDEYKALGLHERELTREAVAAAIAKAPRLLQRPVVVRGDRAVIARPPERVGELFE